MSNGRCPDCGGMVELRRRVADLETRLKLAESAKVLKVVEAARTVKARMREHAPFENTIMPIEVNDELEAMLDKAIAELDGEAKA